jgi:hypothetical protein
VTLALATLYKHPFQIQITNKQTDVKQVRCSGDKPVCRRCSRLRHACIYSAKSVNSGNVPQVDGTSSLLQSARVTDTPPTPVSTTTPSREEGHSTYRGSYGAETTRNKYPIPPLLLTSPSQDYNLGIPESLVSSLIEVYYSDVYNASLLVHKRMFLEAVAAGTARPQVVLSVCAIASMYD